MPFGKDGYGQYRDDMAQSMYQQGKDNTLASQYASNAKDALKKWKTRIGDGEFIVYTEAKPDGERVTSLDELYSLLADINKLHFPESLEAAYTVIANMFMPSSLKQGVECGAKPKLSVYLKNLIDLGIIKRELPVLTSPNEKVNVNRGAYRLTDSFFRFWFAFVYQPSINRKQIEDLASLRFMDTKSNIIFMGSSGVGKTHLATAIGIEAASRRISTYFVNFATMMNKFKQAAKEKPR